MKKFNTTNLAAHLKMRHGKGYDEFLKSKSVPVKKAAVLLSNTIWSVTQ